MLVWIDRGDGWIGATAGLGATVGLVGLWLLGDVGLENDGEMTMVGVVGELGTEVTGDCGRLALAGTYWGFW